MRKIKLFCMMVFVLALFTGCGEKEEQVILKNDAENSMEAMSEEEEADNKEPVINIGKYPLMISAIEGAMSTMDVEIPIDAELVKVQESKISYDMGTKTVIISAYGSGGEVKENIEGSWKNRTKNDFLEEESDAPQNFNFDDYEIWAYKIVRETKSGREYEGCILFEIKKTSFVRLDVWDTEDFSFEEMWSCVKLGEVQEEAVNGDYVSAIIGVNQELLKVGVNDKVYAVGEGDDFHTTEFADGIELNVYRSGEVAPFSNDGYSLNYTTYDKYYNELYEDYKENTRTVRISFDAKSAEEVIMLHRNTWEEAKMGGYIDDSLTEKYEYYQKDGFNVWFSKLVYYSDSLYKEAKYRVTVQLSENCFMEFYTVPDTIYDKENNPIWYSFEEIWGLINLK